MLLTRPLFAREEPRLVYFARPPCHFSMSGVSRASDALSTSSQKEAS